MTKKVPLFIVLGALFGMPFHMAQAAVTTDNIAPYRIDPSRIKATADASLDGKNTEEKLFNFDIASIAPPDAKEKYTETPDSEPKPTVRIVHKVASAPSPEKQNAQGDNDQVELVQKAEPISTISVKAGSHAESKPAVPPTVRKLDIAAYQNDAKSAVSKSRAVQRAVSYSVRGKRYTTLPTSDGFVQTGRASWYGKRFHGRKTASGERFDMNAMTAAHKRLPLGSKIEVTNNANGKKVIVTVNDRGPFHGNRVLDLSKAAAQKLGVIHAGTAEVTIRAL